MTAATLLAATANRFLPKHFGIWVLMLFACLFCGLLIGVSPVIAAGFVMAVFGSILGMAIPLHWMILGEILLATLVAGSIEYFLGVSQANWLPFLLGLVLAMRALLEKLSAPPVTRAIPEHTEKLIWIPCLLYVFAAIASTLLNLSPVMQLLVAIKNYFFMWGLYFAFMVCKDFEALSKNTWRVLIAVAVLQLPAVLYQKFFVAAKLGNAGGSSGLSWDAVSGTFGGGILGGHSAVMALYIAIVIVYGLIQWRDGRWSFTWLMGLLLTTLPSILMAEVKAAIAWLALGGLIVFARQIRKRPAQFIGGTVLITALSAGVAIGYKTMYYEGPQVVSQDELIEKQLYYFFDPDKFNPDTREIGRVASIIFWWRENKDANLAYLTLGHGPGSSRAQSSFAVGVVAKKYAFLIDTSAVTVMLWDIGLLGLMAYLAFQFGCVVRAFQLSQDSKVPPAKAGQLEAAYIGIFLIASSLIYNRGAIDHAATQLLVLFFLALIIQTSRWRNQESTTAAVAKRA